MAEVPPGPSSLLASPGDAASLLSPFPGADEEEEEEEEGGGGGRPCQEKEEEEAAAGDEGGREGPRRRPCPQPPPPPRRNHQLNGLIAAPDLRHLRSSLKGKVLSGGGGGVYEQRRPPGQKGSSSHSMGGHGQEAQQPQQHEGEQEPLPPAPSLSNHHPAPHRVPQPQARTAQQQQQHPRRRQHHHHAPAPSSSSSGDRNGLAGEEEEGAEQELEEEEEEESLLLLSRSLASTCSLQKGPPTDSSWAPQEEEEGDLATRYVRYESELQMPDIMRLITKDLSEPYSIYTYRYFIHNWPQLCFLAMVGDECVGAIVCKLDMHKKMFRRGYIAMLAVDSKYRRKGIGTNLVKKAIYAMVEGDCDEVVLETEITNKSALKLYENLGFVRDKRLFRYYLNGVDALRLKLWLR
ncbi:N-alpha-acetyltransferase 30 [Hemicordylus capensis]|uniref:N-alpha-acetyltransferase 30 n=1 Tax=Hemicordylus capensis TaxID=884348 RepID=UPI002303AC53|nr:N-alpha-acetyltransferase 30 [Hemicordylus capensis]XP_053139848.1 N-alpha-acetyltransferase 30 [Hemicordylus capensis]XP_053139849.1 N-alpha-acetyltransferase 30 [Hemicordylus capensis]